MEVLVADRCDGETASRIETEFPFVTLIRASAKTRPSVPELRKMGVLQARSEIIAVIEEHCVATPHWLATIQGSFGESDVAIGGPILDNDFRRVRDWVVYFSEYHRYLPPWEDGPRFALNGANIAYRRDKLVEQKDALGSGFWEVVLHPRLAEGGGVFRAVNRMGIHHTGPFDYGYYLNQRYLLSRAWGGTQRNQVPAYRRILYLVVAPLLPVLLLLRIANCVFRSRRRIGKFLVSCPLLVPVCIAYVWGEWLGYLLGPGDALERVE